VKEPFELLYLVIVLVYLMGILTGMAWSEILHMERILKSMLKTLKKHAPDAAKESE
jgi:hypothetical protein